jgi:hypothetical protein
VLSLQDLGVFSRQQPAFLQRALWGLHYFSGEKMMEMEMIIWTLVLATIIAVSFYCYNVYYSRRRGNKNENTAGSAEQKKSKDVKTKKNKNELTQGEEKLDPLEKDPQQSESTISPVPEDDPKLVKKNKVREMAGKFVGSSTVQTTESVRQQIAARRQKQVEEDQKRRVAAETKWNQTKAEIERAFSVESSLEPSMVILSSSSLN